MNQDFLYTLFSNAVNQSLMNKETRWQQLPPDQQEALDKMLDAIHDFIENKGKILPQYQEQAFDSVMLKLAAEMGWQIGGQR